MYDIKQALYVHGARERSSYIQIDCIRSYTVTSGLHTFRSLQNFKCILRAFNYPDNGGDCAFVCLWVRRFQKLSTDLDAVLLIDEKCYNKDEITLSTSIHSRGVREANFGLQVYGVYPCMARLQRRQCRSTIRAPNNVGSYTMWRKTTKFIMKTRLGELMILRYSGGGAIFFLCSYAHSRCSAQNYRQVSEVTTAWRYRCDYYYYVVILCWSLHCTLSLAAQCIVIGPVCGGRAL